MRAGLVLLGLLGAASLTQGWFLGLTDLCCGEVQAQCRDRCNTQVRHSSVFSCNKSEVSWIGVRGSVHWPVRCVPEELWSLQLLRHHLLLLHGHDHQHHILLLHVHLQRWQLWLFLRPDMLRWEQPLQQKLLWSGSKLLSHSGSKQPHHHHHLSLT